MIEYGLLGPLSVRVDGRQVDLGGARQRAVLAVLLLHRDTVVSSDRLIDLVWGEDPPPTAETALQGHISRLRRGIGVARIETRVPGYLLRTGPGEVDIDRFEALVSGARDVSPRLAGVRLREALAMVRGPALADLAWEALAETEVARIEELCLGALEARIDADLAAGRDEPLVPELEMLTALHPYRERLRAQHMLALYRAGRQADALAAYRAARTALEEGLGIDPGPELQAMQVAILRQDSVLEAPTPADVAPGNLPVPPSLLVGRHGELAEIRELFAGPARLVTITGPGGTGKTRLALEVAHAMTGEDRDGAWFVDLAAATDEGRAVAAIQTILGVADSGAADPLEAVRAFLGPRRVLLVLDNLEQVPDAARPIAALLAAAPGLRALATSRAPLSIGAEREYRLSPLSSGAADRPFDLDSPPDAVALFVARARLVAPGFALTPAVAGTVAELCRRLDGLPLAIELAASRVRMLAPAAILERISAGIDLLRSERRDLPARQRSLESAIGWSDALLTPAAGRAFRRCSVFAGGFTLAAFESVCGEPAEDPLEVLGELVEHSLVVRQGPDVAPRFAMLETIRQFAAPRFGESADAETIRERHLRYRVEQAGRATDGLHGPEEAGWLRILREEHDNMRAALSWAATSGRADDLMALTAPLSAYWLRDSHLREGRARIREALADPEAGRLAERALALRNLASITGSLGDVRSAIELALESVAAWEQAGDERGLADALRVASMEYNDAGDVEKARAFALRGLEHAEAVGDERLIVSVRHELAFLAATGGDLETARSLLAQNADVLRRAGDRTWLAGTLSNLGEIYRMLGDPAAAERLVREALDLMREQGEAPGLVAGLTTLGEILSGTERFAEADAALREAIRVADDAHALRELPLALEALGEVQARLGAPLLCVRLFGHADGIRNRSGKDASVPGGIGGVLASVRDVLGSADFEEAWTGGALMPLEELLSQPETAPDAGKRAGSIGPGPQA
jgi:predicted ATPase/DNA-binding SARP family transcriptional activator